MDGFLLINKPQNMTSFSAIREVQRKVGKIKIGHSGTLDPQTDGLLVLAIGKGCKLLKEVTLDSHKTYIAKMKFGIKTSTGDIDGEVLEEEKVSLDKEVIENVFSKFIKTYKQVPPMYSAKKINGKRAYELARQGKVVNMENNAKEITIFRNEILNIDLTSQEVEFEVEVSKGTYIRSLIEDMASELNTVATMICLKRTKTDGFNLQDAINLDDKLNEDLIKQNIISLTSFFQMRNYIMHEVEGKLAHLVQNGVRIENENIISQFDKVATTERILLYNKNTEELIALYEKKENKYIPYIML